MKRGKEEKTVGPMFPRLHINDTGKGGPRAPPRNKMALYEQLSIPSNRFTHSAASLVRPSGQIKAFSTSSAEEKVEVLKKHTDSSGELKNNNRVEYNPDSGRCNPSVLDGNIVALEGRSESTSVMDFPSKGQDILHDISESTSVMDQSEGQNNLHDVSNKTDFKDSPCQSQQMKILERVDSLSENSVVDSISRLDVMPDDVVGLIGQEHFWKARREIINQQRIFAVQVFELHRLIKVQRLIAASPQILLKDFIFTKPIKASPGKRKSLNDPVKKSLHVSKSKGRPKKLVHKTKITAENASEKKLSFASTPNGSQPPSFNSGPWGFSPQPLGNHWLIPVMSPSEGLVYKPYLGPGLMGPAYEGYGPPGSSPLMCNFPYPMYGVGGPHSGMSVTSSPTFSSSSTGQSSGIPFLGWALARDVTAHQKPNFNSTEEVETQASFESRSVLPLFPTSPTTDGPKSGPLKLEPMGPTRVIKVVPHNVRSARESAARIFKRIQEGRKQN